MQNGNMLGYRNGKNKSLECKFKFQYRGAALDFNLTEDFRTFLLYNYQAGSHKRGGLK